MPIITVVGIPSGPKSPVQLDLLELTLKSVPCRFTALPLTRDDVSVFFVRSLRNTWGSSLVAYVDLYAKPERTLELRQMLCQMIADELIVYAAANLPHIKRVAVVMRPVDPEQGPWINRDVKVPLEP